MCTSCIAFCCSALIPDPTSSWDGAHAPCMLPGSGLGAHINFTPAHHCQSATIRVNKLSRMLTSASRSVQQSSRKLAEPHSNAASSSPSTHTAPTGAARPTQEHMRRPDQNESNEELYIKIYSRSSSVPALLLSSAIRELTACGSGHPHARGFPARAGIDVDKRAHPSGAVLVRDFRM